MATPKVDPPLKPDALRIVIDVNMATGQVWATGPDMVDAAPIWDYVLAYLQRLQTREWLKRQAGDGVSRVLSLG